MYQSIKKLAVILLLFSLSLACESKPSLQTFYVDHEEKQGFISFDIPTSFLDIEDKLTDKQKEAYDSVDKFNIITFMIEEGGRDNYEKYLKELNSIFKNPSYEELMRGNIEGGKFKLMFTGEEDALDELRKIHPLKRIAYPNEVAKLALFLASENTGFIHGANLTLDGGISSVLKDL